MSRSSRPPLEGAKTRGPLSDFGAGGFYAMVARGLGGAAGGAAGMIAVVGYVTLQVALYGILGAVTSESL